MQNLQDRSGSGVVTIPKHHLDRDGLLDSDGDPNTDQQLTVDRLGERVYLIRMCDGNVPEVKECEVIERLAAQRAQELLSENVFGQVRAD